MNTLIVFLGASTGGIISLMLANKVPITEIDKMYSSEVTGKMFTLKIFPFFQSLFNSKYNSKSKRSAFKEQLDRHTVTVRWQRI